MADRVIKGQGGLLTAYFEAPDGTPTDPTGTPTVAIVADDGTTVQASTAATPSADGSGRVQYTVAPTLATRLDYWAVTWTATIAGVSRTATTYADVAGGFMFSLQSLKEDLKASYTIDQLRRVRVRAEDALEEACGVAFVPRYRKQALSGNGTSWLLLGAPRLRSIRSATAAGVAVTDTITPQADGSAYLAYTQWPVGHANIAVVYEHGWDTPPPRVAKAARILAKSYLVDGPFDERATSMTTDLGTFTLQTPGLRGSYFGIPEVDAVVDEYRVRFGVA